MNPFDSAINYAWNQKSAKVNVEPSEGFTVEAAPAGTALNTEASKETAAELAADMEARKAELRAAGVGVNAAFDTAVTEPTPEEEAQFEKDTVVLLELAEHGASTEELTTTFVNSALGMAIIRRGAIDAIRGGKVEKEDAPDFEKMGLTVEMQSAIKEEIVTLKKMVAEGATVEKVVDTFLHMQVGKIVIDMAVKGFLEDASKEAKPAVENKPAEAGRKKTSK